MAFIFIFLLSFWAEASELRPFVSDGCTMAPDGTRREPEKWKECCQAHDLRLWGGGTKTERHEADKKLRSCMREKAGPRLAFIFWLGVKIGSHSPVKLPEKKWGNAWYKNSGYRTLNQDEINQLILEVQYLDLDPALKNDYINELNARN